MTVLHVFIYLFIYLFIQSVYYLFDQLSQISSTKKENKRFSASCFRSSQSQWPLCITCAACYRYNTRIVCSHPIRGMDISLLVSVHADAFRRVDLPSTQLRNVCRKITDQKTGRTTEPYKHISAFWRTLRWCHNNQKDFLRRLLTDHSNCTVIVSIDFNKPEQFCYSKQLASLQIHLLFRQIDC
jgi:hypothetical protein